jgi:hypothetical protein
MKPHLLAEHISVDELSPIYLDRLAVRFQDDVSPAQIDAINAQIGAGILLCFAPRNYCLLKLPASISLKQAVTYYEGRAEVRYTAPDMPIGPAEASPPQVLPCDPAFQNPGPFTTVKAPQAWALTTGTRAGALIGVVDSGFDLRQPDLLNNWAINQNELPSKYFGQDRQPGRVVSQADINRLDTDGDGRITFADLNNFAVPTMLNLCWDRVPNPGCPATLPNGTPWPSCDVDCDGVITPNDLVSNHQPDPFNRGDSGRYLGVFEDSVDGDCDFPTPQLPTGCNGLVDDVVGWDFTANRNTIPLVGIPGQPFNSCQFSHATVVSGIIGAEGHATACQPTDQTAGMNWSAQVIPIAAVAGLAQGDTQSSRAVTAMGLMYAISRGAAAINASFAAIYSTQARPPGASCPTSQVFLGPLAQNLFGKMTDAFAKEEVDLDFSRSLLVAAAGNCTVNYDDRDNFRIWPAGQPQCHPGGSHHSQWRIVRRPRQWLRRHRRSWYQLHWPGRSRGSPRYARLGRSHVDPLSGNLVLYTNGHRHAWPDGSERSRDHYRATAQPAALQRDAPDQPPPLCCGRAVPQHLRRCGQLRWLPVGAEDGCTRAHTGGAGVGTRCQGDHHPGRHRAARSSPARRRRPGRSVCGQRRPSG